MNLSAQPLAGVSVLYVEDDSDVREVITMALERYGATVRQVSTAAEALAVFLDSPPAVVVADVALPVNDGIWLLEQVRSRTATRVPFIAFTALALQRDRDSILAAGFADYVVKPIEAEVLVDAIARALIGG